MVQEFSNEVAYRYEVVIEEAKQEKWFKVFKRESLEEVRWHIGQIENVSQFRIQNLTEI